MSEKLRFAFNQGEHGGGGWKTNEQDVADELAAHLGLPRPSRDYPTATQLLLDLIPALEDLVSGRAPNDVLSWARTTTMTLTKGYTMEQLYRVLRGFGWQDERVIGEPSFRDLAEVMRCTVANNLAIRLVGVHDAWQNARVFDVTISRQGRVDPRARRDRAMTRTYQPPGRT